MASEQTRFDDMTTRLGEMSDQESPEFETLSAELMAVQANLATLMARNMKCFTQVSHGSTSLTRIYRLDAQITIDILILNDYQDDQSQDLASMQGNPQIKTIDFGNKY